jgi:hypothetical protein
VLSRGTTLLPRSESPCLSSWSDIPERCEQQQERAGQLVEAVGHAGRVGCRHRVGVAQVRRALRGVVKQEPDIDVGAVALVEHQAAGGGVDEQEDPPDPGRPPQLYDEDDKRECRQRDREVVDDVVERAERDEADGTTPLHEAERDEGAGGEADQQRRVLDAGA